MICRNDGNFELYKDKHSFVLGGMENMKFTEYELDLCEGDTLFVYTDGVVEAENESGEDLRKKEWSIRSTNTRIATNSSLWKI